MRTVAGLLVMKEECVLLVFKNGFWFFPGGKQEKDETLEDTILRELQEELRLVCRKPDLRYVHGGVFNAPQGEVFRFETFTCAPQMLIGTPMLNPADTVKNWGWIDHPWELNLTPHARFVIERQWGSTEAAM